MNLAELCFRKKVVTYGLAAALALAGVISYFQLGRLEDPEFTIRCAQIITLWPGATPQEVAESVTDPLETAVQRLGKVKHVTSTSYPGRSVILVEMQDHFTGDELPQIWDELRRKVGDAAPSLPEGCSKPAVYDDYGDVYGVLYAISGDGYSYAELKSYAKFLRRELLLCKDVAKIDFIGERDETVNFEIQRDRLAALGITPDELVAAIKGQNVPAESGNLRIDGKYIRLDPSARIRSVEDFGEIVLRPGLYVKDVVKIVRDYEDPPRAIARYNGKPFIGLGISTAKGGNVVKMGQAVEKRMAELSAQVPVGLEVNVISHQATSVVTAIDGFVVNLLESVVLVIAVLLITMGLRSGLIIGSILIVTVLGTVMVMNMTGLMFERISLGAFIIALGMLVDNAIVITEAVLVAAQKGESKMEAAIAVVRQTQWALLGGTAIAVLSFAPIGACHNATGEYCRSLFLVILISLLISWIMAITLTPLVAERFLPSVPKGEGREEQDPYGGRWFGLYRRFLGWCIDNRRFTIFALLCMLVSSFLCFGHLKQNFFPDSTRPQFMVHVWMPEGNLVYDTDDNVQRLATKIGKLEGVTGTSTFTGKGALRFLLTYTPEDEDSAYGLILVDVAEEKCINPLMREIEEFSPDTVPDAMVGCQRFVLGPGDSHRIQMRIIGPDPAVLREFGERALAVMHADTTLKEVQSDWRNRTELVVPVIAERRARKLGVSRADIAAAFRMATDGLPIGTYLEGDESIPVLLRSAERERRRPEDLAAAWAWSSRRQLVVPLAQLLDRVDNTSEESLLKRRDRAFCLTVMCNQDPRETAAEAFDRLRPKLEEVGAQLPSGYTYEWGGEYEDSGEAFSNLVPTFGPILVAMVLVVLCLFNSARRTLVIFMTLPLIIVGVVAGLLTFDQPFGFMALLGLLSLVGMQVKNAIVLMDEISARLEAGDTPYQAIMSAGVSRVRPVANASLTTILGMLPLVADPFYAAMAVTIMFGLAFSTVLTVVVIPVNYALVFRVKKDPAPAFFCPVPGRGEPDWPEGGPGPGPGRGILGPGSPARAPLMSGMGEIASLKKGAPCGAPFLAGCLGSPICGGGPGRPGGRPGPAGRARGRPRGHRR